MPALLLALLFVLAPLTAIAQGNSPVDCGAPAAAQDGWHVAAPAAVGLDPATLCGIGPRFKAWTAAKIDAVLVIRHRKLVYEQYFADYGTADSVGTIIFDPTAKHALHSITKSITALVLGIEIGKGHIAGIDQPVLPQLPDYADLRSPEKDQITVRHLLTMSQGLAWNEDIPYRNPMNSETQMLHALDPVRFVLAQPVEQRPGMVFNYSGGSATVIAALLRKATGQTVDTLAQTDLFEPLGITDVQWNYFLRDDFLPGGPTPAGGLEMHPRDPGDPMAFGGLEMHPRDLAKIGQLVLDHGVWQGKQVVPADWIAAATAPQINGPGISFYGYQFWLGRSLLHGQEIDWAAGRGYGSQWLYIVPALDLVVLVHASLNSSSGSMQDSAPQILNRYVLQAVNAP